MPYPSRRTRNTKVDVKGEKRSNAIHASTTDPEARLYKKTTGTGARLCFLGGRRSENGPGDRFPDDGADLEPARICRAGRSDAGRWTRRTARGAGPSPSASDQWRHHGSMHRHSRGSARRLTLGADKGKDAAAFVADLRNACHSACRPEIAMLRHRWPHHPARRLRPVPEAPQTDRRGLRQGILTMAC